MSDLKYIALSAYKSNTYMYLDVKSSNTQTADTCALRMHTPTPTHKYIHLDTLAPQGRGTEEKVCEKKQVFNEDLKELTEDALRIETGSLFHVVGAW